MGCGGTAAYVKHARNAEPMKREIRFKYNDDDGRHVNVNARVRKTTENGDSTTHD